MLQPVDVVEALPELTIAVEPSQALEWQAQIQRRYRGWYDLATEDEVVGIARLMAEDGDWMTIQTKRVDERGEGRYAQVMNLGGCYQVEVAQVQGHITHNWRVGLGAVSDDSPNVPYVGADASQELSFAAMIEVLLSWLRGSGVPLGYGAALHMYQ